MKTLGIIILGLLSLNSFAVSSKSHLYAKVDGKVVKCTYYRAETQETNAYITSSGDCSGYEFLTGDAFCFTGKRSDLIDALSGDHFDFDEEWVDGASYHGKDLSFYINDGPNDISEKLIAKRCTKKFFKK